MAYLRRSMSQKGNAMLHITCKPSFAEFEEKQLHSS